MQYLQAIHLIVLVLATLAIIVAVSRVVADAWRGRKADGEHLAVVMLGREIRRQSERGGEAAPALQRRLTALQEREPRSSSDRRNLDLRHAPVYFVVAILLQWVTGRLLGESLSTWPMAGNALLAAVAGICVAHLLRLRGLRRGRSDAAAYAFVALLAVLSALTEVGS